jgi:hypothetical protein
MEQSPLLHPAFRLVKSGLIICLQMKLLRWN